MPIECGWFGPALFLREFPVTIDSNTERMTTQYVARAMPRPEVATCIQSNFLIRWNIWSRNYPDHLTSAPFQLSKLWQDLEKVPFLFA